MSVLNARKKSIVAVVTMALVLMCASVVAFAHYGRSGKRIDDDGSKLVGDWTGESICIGNNPACHDEKVIYHLSKAEGKPCVFILGADKIINGKPEQMYVQELKYDSEKQTLTGEFTKNQYHGRWEYQIKGETMEGTLKLLPAETIVRRIKVAKAHER